MTQLNDLLDGCQAPVQVGHHTDRDTVQQRPDRSGGQAQVRGVDVGVGHLTPCATGCRRRVATSIGRCEHGAVTTLPDCPDGQLERIGSAGHANTVAHADEIGELLLECLVFGAMDVPAALSHSQQRRLRHLEVAVETTQQVVHGDCQDIISLANKAPSISADPLVP
jgi:hypothetical protein